METTFFRSLPKQLFFASLCSFICMSAGCVSTFRTCVQGYLEWLPFVFCFLPSFRAFVIDFLSIRKVIIFSAIATDDRHPLRSRSIHQNAANCMTIRFRYIAQPRGVRSVKDKAKYMVCQNGRSKSSLICHCSLQTRMTFLY